VEYESSVHTRLTARQDHGVAAFYQVHFKTPFLGQLLCAVSFSLAPLGILKRYSTFDVVLDE